MSHTPLTTRLGGNSSLPFNSVQVFISVSIYWNVSFSVMMSNFLPPSPAGRPSSHSIRDARWLVVTTTSQAACSSPGSATIKAGSPQTRYASTSGTPCRTCSRTVPIRPCSSLICECLDQLLLFISYFLPFAIISIWS